MINFRCEKYKTYFDSTELKGSGLQVPKDIIWQLRDSAKKSTGGEWEPGLFDALKIGPHFLMTHKCMSKDEVINLFEKTKKRHRIISISQPIFDDKFEHCVVSVSFWNYIGSSSGQKYFLKKVYGKWVILDIYNIWMS